MATQDLTALYRAGLAKQQAGDIAGARAIYHCAPGYGPG
jgi:hypothetical protein